MVTYENTSVNYYFRPKRQARLIDLEKLRDYLSSIYILKKKEQDRIIRYYELGVKENKRESYLGQALENMGYDDTTIYDITRYILYWNARVNADAEVENARR